MRKSLISAKKDLITFPKHLKQSDFNYHLFIESFGVKIKLSANAQPVLESLEKILPNYLTDNFQLKKEFSPEHNFLYVWNKMGRDSLYKNGKRSLTRISRDSLIAYTASQIRLTVAEFAVERVFVHAGVVSWKNKAILIPAGSFQGKTTLTAELVKCGAVYYSDEYAVLDRNGFVYPFAKPLSLRGIIDEYRQIDRPVESFGGIAGTEKIPVGMILLTQFKPKSNWKPKILKPAKGIIETIKHTVPIRHNPQFTIEVLKKVAGCAVFVKSNRGEAVEFAETILNFFERTV